MAARPGSLPPRRASSSSNQPRAASLPPVPVFVQTASPAARSLPPGTVMGPPPPSPRALPIVPIFPPSPAAAVAPPSPRAAFAVPVRPMAPAPPAAIAALVQPVAPAAPVVVRPDAAQDRFFYGSMPMEAQNLKDEDIFAHRDLDGELSQGGGDIFTRIDRNKDGVITREEFLEALAGQQRDPELGLVGFTLPGLDVDPDLDLDLDVDVPKVDMPNLDFVPDINMKGLKVGLPGLKGPNFNAPRLPGVDIDVPDLDFEEPKLNLSPFEKCMTRCDAMCDKYEICCGIGVYKLFTRCFGVGRFDVLTATMTRQLPWLFTFLCCLLFAPAIMMILRLSGDMQVQYWISDQLKIVLALPVLYLATHIVHAQKREPHRVLVILSLVGSCVFLLLLGDLVMMSAYHKANALAANDCSTDEAKRMLQVQWQSAQAFYRTCMKETAASSGVEEEVPYSLYRIQDCQGYSAQLEANPAWPYLGALEQTYQCGGWCDRDQPLWTFKSVKDSCSASVADVLYNKVQWDMLELVFYTGAVLFFVSLVLIQTGPILKSFSIVW